MIFAFLEVSLQLWGASLGTDRPLLSLGAGLVSSSSESEGSEGEEGG